MKIKILSRFVDMFRRSADYIRLNSWSEWLDGGWQLTITKQTVNSETVLKIPAVLAAVRLIAGNIGSFPCILYREDGDGNKKKLVNNDLFWLLKTRPNPENTAMEFWETMQHHILLVGNAFAWLKRDETGKVIEAWILKPENVQISRVMGELVYKVKTDQGTERILFRDEILHYKGFSRDGILGLSPITIAREAFGLGLTQEEYAARLFANGATPKGILSQEGPMTDEQRKAAKKSWQKAYGGVRNAGKVAFLPGNIKWQQVSMNPEDAQFLESRKFQIAEIARIFNIQMHLLQELDRSTNNNIEHQGLEFVTYTLRPWLVRLEQCIERDIIGFSNVKKGMYVKFNHSALLRGDTNTQSTAINGYVQSGVYTRDEAREILDMNPLPDGQGKTALAPLNMAPVGQNQDKNASKRDYDPGEYDDLFDENEAKNAENRAKMALKGLISHEIDRIVRKECKAVSEQAKRSTMKEFSDWLPEFQRKIRVDIERSLDPIIKNAILCFGGDDSKRSELIKSIADKYVAGSKVDLIDCLTSIAERGLISWSVALVEIEKVTRNWEGTKSGVFADYILDTITGGYDNERAA